MSSTISIDPHPVPEHQSITPPRTSFWRKLGGGSLTISIIVHAMLLAIGVVWIFQIIPEKKPDIDFLAKGGGGGTPGAKSELNKKRRATMTTLNAPRLSSKGASSTFILPEPDPASAMASVGALSAGGLSGGLGGSGSGGGKGNGHGTGIGDGNGPGLGANAMGARPFAGLMFGKPVKARSIGVVLDVSGSMGPHLPRVIKELDRVASGSPLILYYGCGITPGRPEIRSYPTMGDIDAKRFEHYWRTTNDPAYRNEFLREGSAKVKVDFNQPMPAESLYQIMANRPNTYYVEYQGVGFAYAALLARELREVEAVYWFSDFEDPVDEKEAKGVMFRLRGKKQKLYIHPSIEGHSFSKVRDLICLPTDGEVIDAK